MAMMTSGCISGDVVLAGGLEGKYISEENSNYYLELYEDGTFFSQENSGMSGTWEQKQKGEIILSTPLQASKAKIEGNALIDKDGDRWVKQGKYKEMKREQEKTTSIEYPIETNHKKVLLEDRCKEIESHPHMNYDCICTPLYDNESAQKDEVQTKTVPACRCKCDIGNGEIWTTDVRVSK